MKPTKEHMVKWAKDLCEIYDRIPTSRMRIYVEYLNDLTFDDWNRVVDAVPEKFRLRLRKFQRSLYLEEMMNGN